MCLSGCVLALWAEEYRTEKCPGIVLWWGEAETDILA